MATAADGFILGLMRARDTKMSEDVAGGFIGVIDFNVR